MDFKSYVQNVVASYVARDSENLLFIKHYNTLQITENEMLAQIDRKDNEIFYFHEYKLHEMHNTFAPFMDWIRKCYSTHYKEKMSVEEFLRSAGVYPVQLEVLAGYIQNKICYRTEDSLHFEVGYETDRMLENIAAVLKYISKDYHLILIISKLHLAPYSTIKLLKRLVNRPLNIHAILMYNDEFVITDYKRALWNDLMLEADRQDLQLEWGSVDSERSMEVLDEFWYYKISLQEYLRKLKNMFFTYSLEDAIYYFNNIISRLDEKTVTMTDDELIEFYSGAAWVFMYAKQSDLALVMCDKLTEQQCQKSEDLELRYNYYYICAKVRCFADQPDAVKLYCQKAVQVAHEMGDSFLECRARIPIYVVDSSMGRDLFEYEFKYQSNTELVGQAKLHGFMNFLSYLYVFGFDNDPQSMEEIATGKREPYYLNLAIDIGKKLDNDNLILNAYMKNIIQYSQAGFHSYVGILYQKRLEVLGTQNQVRQAHMLAGLGYNSVILEEYEKAHGYLEESVKKLALIDQAPEVQSMDIMNSLYNVALIDFVAENYRGAMLAVEFIMKMLKELSYYNIRACSNTKLFTIIAISCYYLREYYNSYFYLSKIEIIVEHMIWTLRKGDQGNYDEDIMMYHLVKGIMYSYEENYESCMEEFSELKEESETCHGSSFFIMPIYYIELSNMYLKQGMIQAAEEVIDEGIQFCEDEKLLRKKERLIYFKEHHVVNPIPMMTLDGNLPLDDIMQIAQRASVQLKLTKREKDIQFLTVLQEAISRENLSVDDLYVNLCSVIKNSYGIDKIIILRRRNGKCEYILDDENRLLQDHEIDEIFDFFRSYRQAFFSNRIDKNFSQFENLMIKYFKKPTMTLIGIPMLEETGTETVFLGYLKVNRKTINALTLFNGDDLMILKFAFSQFCEMMRRIDSRNMIERMNQKLERSAVTDHLTGITNRTGFSKQVEMICAQGNVENNVLLYIDLDNFKYYNDTFGHDIGDLVLVTFAELLKRMTKDTGLAVRYGGDEFIVLLYDKTEQEGVDFAVHIYREIEDGFVEEISNKLKQDIIIPKEKKISCSIGIAGFCGGSKEHLEQALIRADQMLYYVKRHGKSTFKLYDAKDVIASS